MRESGEERRITEPAVMVRLEVIEVEQVVEPWVHLPTLRVPRSNPVGDNQNIRLVVQAGPFTQNEIIVVQLS